jgi:hypothetical protein
MTRVLQIKKGSFRRVGLVDEPHVRLLDGCYSIYVLAQIAIEVPKKLSEVAHQRRPATNSAMNLSIRGVLSGKRFPRLTFLRYQLAALFPALD